MTRKTRLLDLLVAPENVLTGLGAVAIAQVLFPDLLGRWSPGPHYAFALGAGLIMAGSYWRNRRRAAADKDRRP